MISTKLKYLLWVITFFIACKASAKDVLIWRVIDWPPFYILYGKDKGQGIYDQLIEKVSKALPEYEHVKIQMNTKRVLKEIELGKNVCHPSALSDTPALLSKSNSFLLPHRIIFDERKKPSLPLANIVSLGQLLSNKNFMLGISRDRYPTELNKILNKYKHQHNVVNQNNYNNLIRMFFRKRVDALIEYPPVITYSKRFLNKEINNTSVAIQELAHSPYIPVYFACPDTPWGKKLIKKINNVLIKESQNEDYLEFRLRWYDDVSKGILKQFYQNHYLLDKQ